MRPTLLPTIFTNNPLSSSFSASFLHSYSSCPFSTSVLCTICSEKAVTRLTLMENPSSQLTSFFLDLLPLSPALKLFWDQALAIERGIFKKYIALWFQYRLFLLKAIQDIALWLGGALWWPPRRISSSKWLRWWQTWWERESGLISSIDSSEGFTKRRVPGAYSTHTLRV